MLKLLKKRTSLFGLFFIVLTGLALTGQMTSAKAGNTSKTADLRLIFTTDIHGQLSSTDYETGTVLTTGGLTRAYNLIKQARGETLNHLTFDIGDVIYDYTTEYIYAQNQSIVQPIYQAMMTIGYDAVTLGNHEFDYDYDYLVSQLKNSGMLSKVIVSNVTDPKTGEHPFLENMIINKTLTTSDGSTMEVKVGVIGETLPVLSSKGQDFAGVLKVQDIVENVTQQAAKLKEAGADLVIVLSHSGMGSENPLYGDKNVSYALTKIDDVDAVLCGHEHNAFPTEDKTGAYYKLSGVDKTTNLVNGKNLVMAEDRGESIGVIDMTLQMQDGEVVITKRNSEVRKATSANTVEEASIAGLYDEWSAGMLEYTKEVIGTVNQDDLIENFTGLVEDSTAMQLLNDAKRAYAYNYIYNKAPSYINYPVIAASSYVSYGENSYSDYVNIAGELTESDLASLQGYNGYTALYKITGAQLREWLEWSASAYTQVNQKSSSVGTVAEYVQSSGVQSLIADDWLNDWSTFYVFDGIEYSINPMIAARYNHSGVKVNSTFRVTDLTYNGEKVTDDQVFVLAVGKLAKVTEANSGVEKQAIYKGYIDTQGVIKDYIEQKSKLGSLDVTPDYNWNLILPSNYQFLTKTTTLGAEQLKNSSWFVKQLGIKDNYIYGIGSFSKKSNQNTTKIFLSETYTGATSDKVKVAVAATSKSQIVEVKYAKGSYEADSLTWKFANEVTGGYFNADSNGIYTVYAVDKEGNASVEQIKIDNIYEGILKKPILATYTNRKTKITGTAEPGSTIIIETGTNTYKTVADTNGSFQYALPAQNSGTKLTLYAINEKNNHLSEEVIVTVKRTGPNKPKVYGVYNNSNLIQGNLNDVDGNVFAIVNNTVYVGNEKTAEFYRNCVDLYNEDYKVVVTEVRVDSANEYMLTIPVQKIGTKINVYNIDHISRASMVNTVTVQDAAPNPPRVYELTAADNKIEGYITSSTANTIFTVYITVKNTDYVLTTDKTGYFSLDVDPSMLKVGTQVSVYAKDKVNYINRTSYTTVLTVKDPESFVSDKNDLSLGDMYTAETEITGYYDSTDEVTVAIKSNGTYSVYKVIPSSSGDFTVSLTEPLKAGDIIYAHTMTANGSILDMVKATVELTVPVKPVLEREINNLTKNVVVYTDVESKLVVKIGKKTYESAEFVFNDVEGMYQFNIKIPQTASGTKIHIYAYNSAGTSETRTITVTQVVPDAPTVNKVDTTTKSLKGTIAVVGETKVYATIGKDTYEGTVKEDGSFTIKIPVQTAKTKIVVWGENAEGKGLKTTVQVTKKEETATKKSTDQ